MLTSGMCGNENFSGLTNQLVPAMPKESFCLRIDRDNHAELIHDDNGVRRRLHQSLTLHISNLAFSPAKRRRDKCGWIACVSSWRLDGKRFHFEYSKRPKVERIWSLATCHQKLCGAEHTVGLCLAE